MNNNYYLNLNSTFGMIGKTVADKMIAKVVSKLKLLLQRE